MKQKLKNKGSLRLIIKQDETCIVIDADTDSYYPSDIVIEDFKTQKKVDAEIKRLGLARTDDE